MENWIGAYRLPPQLGLGVERGGPETPEEPAEGANDPEETAWWAARRCPGTGGAFAPGCGLGSSGLG